MTTASADTPRGTPTYQRPPWIVVTAIGKQIISITSSGDRTEEDRRQVARARKSTPMLSASAITPSSIVELRCLACGSSARTRVYAPAASSPAPCSAMSPAAQAAGPLRVLEAGDDAVAAGRGLSEGGMSPEFRATRWVPSFS